MGSAAGIASAQQPIQAVRTRGQPFWVSVASAGDVNGDGFASDRRCVRWTGYGHIYIRGSAVGLRFFAAHVIAVPTDEATSAYDRERWRRQWRWLRRRLSAPMLLGMRALVTRSGDLLRASGPSSANHIRHSPRRQDLRRSRGDLNGDGYADIRHRRVIVYLGRALVGDLYFRRSNRSMSAVDPDGDGTGCREWLSVRGRVPAMSMATVTLTSSLEPPLLQVWTGTAYVYSGQLNQAIFRPTTDGSDRTDGATPKYGFSSRRLTTSMAMDTRDIIVGALGAPHGQRLHVFRRLGTTARSIAACPGSRHMPCGAPLESRVLTGDINGDGYADVATGDDGYMDCLGVSISMSEALQDSLPPQQPTILTGP